MLATLPSSPGLWTEYMSTWLGYRRSRSLLLLLASLLLWLPQFVGVVVVGLSVFHAHCTVHRYHQGIGVRPATLVFRFFTPMREEFVPDLVLGVANLRRDLLLALRGSIFPDAVDVLLVPNLTATE